MNQNLVILLALALAACQGQGPETRLDPASPIKSGQSASSAPDGTERTAHAELPSPADVIDAIYHRKGDGSSGYVIDDGCWAQYWYGHEFALDGQQYFTGFVYKTTGQACDPASDEIFGLGDGVDVAEATWRLGAGAVDDAWALVSSKNNLGKFGANGKADAIDENRQPLVHPVSTGSILAIPTTSLSAGGTVVSSFELFLLEKRRMRWSYIGYVVAGTDNAAGCASDADMQGLPPCSASFGTLEFKDGENGHMPIIRVHMSGTTISGPGHTRSLDDQDAAEYDFEVETKRYQLH